MTEAQADELLCYMFKFDASIPEWGNWVAIDSDGEVSVFHSYPVLIFTDHSGLMWNEVMNQGKRKGHQILFYYDGYIPFTETQIISVKDLLA